MQLAWMLQDFRSPCHSAQRQTQCTVHRGKLSWEQDQDAQVTRNLQGPIMDTQAVMLLPLAEMMTPGGSQDLGTMVERRR